MAWPPWLDKVLFTIIPVVVSLATIGISIFGIDAGLKARQGLVVYFAILLLLTTPTGFLFATPRYRGRWFVLLPAMLSVLVMGATFFILTIATGRLSFDTLWPSGLLFFVLLGIFVDSVVLGGLQARPLLVTESGFRAPRVPKVRILRGKSFVRFAEVKETKEVSSDDGGHGIALRLQDGSILVLMESQGVPAEFLKRLAQLTSP